MGSPVTAAVLRRSESTRLQLNASENVLAFRHFRRRLGRGSAFVLEVVISESQIWVCLAY